MWHTRITQTILPRASCDLARGRMSCPVYDEEYLGTSR